MHISQYDQENLQETGKNYLQYGLKETRDDRFVSFQHILVLPGIVWS